jgi:hypothetical protein
MLLLLLLLPAHPDLCTASAVFYCAYASKALLGQPVLSGDGTLGALGCCLTAAAAVWLLPAAIVSWQPFRDMLLLPLPL